MSKLDKQQIANIFEEIALLLEIQGENPFKVRAYRNAARTLLNLDENLVKVIREGRLTDLEGIGKDLAEKIEQLANTGFLEKYEELKKATPPGLLVLLQVHGLGPKKVKLLHDKVGIQSLESLKEACEKNKIATLKGFGEKTQQNILDALAHRSAYQTRHLWWDAMAIASPILEKLRTLKGVKRAEIAGSLRRKLETIGDLDLLAASSNPAPVMEWFTSQPFVVQILAKGDTKSSVLLIHNIQVDLRIVPGQQFDFALNYFTGSKEHNIKLRQNALTKGWTLSEWGMASETGVPGPFDKWKKRVTEEDLYKALGFDFIPPELREDKGELEAAAKKRLPTLVEEENIRGTFHVHTTASDGHNTLEEMAEAAQKFDWEYLGISDHSKASFQANGLTEERLLSQIDQIQKLNQSKKYKLHIFSGLECDILPNGTLDCSDDTLKRLDFVIVSVHSSFNLKEAAMTKRLIRAIEHPSTTMVGHVTGRLLLQREAYEVNLPKIIDACIANGKIIELNAHPKRLDMDWRLWHTAAEKGLMCSINPDAHSIHELKYVRAGINIARKGWLEKKSILNTLPLNEVAKRLKRN
ncbi:MAG: DNA polymerase/3'-5' exonuclease PolX [Parachlamydia sp.]|nr:DNA polymerase/3'-5' exonuclease PolX [Parachlamydia sp.]